MGLFTSLGTWFSVYDKFLLHVYVTKIIHSRMSLNWSLWHRTVLTHPHGPHSSKSHPLNCVQRPTCSTAYSSPYAQLCATAHTQLCAAAHILNCVQWPTHSTAYSGPHIQLCTMAHTLSCVQRPTPSTVYKGPHSQLCTAVHTLNCVQWPTH